MLHCVVNGLKIAYIQLTARQIQVVNLNIYRLRFLKTGLAKISTHSTTWQFKATKLIQRPIKSLYLTPGSRLVVPRSIRTSPHLT